VLSTVIWGNKGCLTLPRNHHVAGASSLPRFLIITLRVGRLAALLRFHRICSGLCPVPKFGVAKDANRRGALSPRKGVSFEIGQIKRHRNSDSTAFRETVLRIKGTERQRKAAW
jgi:hypothetical protein